MDDLTPLQLANHIAEHDGDDRTHHYRGHQVRIGKGASGVRVSVWADDALPLNRRSLWHDRTEGPTPGMSGAIQLVRDIDQLIDWAHTWAGLDEIEKRNTELRAHRFEDIRRILTDEYGYIPEPSAGIPETNIIARILTALGH